MLLLNTLFREYNVVGGEEGFEGRFGRGGSEGRDLMEEGDIFD